MVEVESAAVRVLNHPRATRFEVESAAVPGRFRQPFEAGLKRR